MKKETAVLDAPVPDKSAEDLIGLIATVKKIEEWARFNDRHIRLICIDALRKVGEWA